MVLSWDLGDAGDGHASRSISHGGGKGPDRVSCFMLRILIALSADSIVTLVYLKIVYVIICPLYFFIKAYYVSLGTLFMCKKKGSASHTRWPEGGETLFLAARA